jgi:hypothetical protein
MRTFLIALLLVGWAHAVEAKPQDRVGKDAEVVFVCKDPKAFNEILSQPTGKEIMEMAQMHEMALACASSPFGVPVKLLEYIGSILITADPPGLGHIYRLESADGTSFYTFMFEPTRGA